MDTSTPQTNVEIPAEVRSYLETLMNDAGVTGVDEQMKEQMLQDLFVRLDSYIASVIVENLPPEKFDEFVQMNEQKKSREEIEAFLQNAVPNAKDLFVQAFTDFRNNYLGNVAVGRDASAAEQKTE